MKNYKKLDDCLESIPESDIAAKWATVCKTLGWFILIIFIIAGILIGSESNSDGILVFFAISFLGSLISVSFLGFGALLDAAAAISQSSAETSRMMYLCLSDNSADISSNNETLNTGNTERPTDSCPAPLSGKTPPLNLPNIE